jgi:hypothetical protein
LFSLLLDFVAVVADGCFSRKEYKGSIGEGGGGVRGEMHFEDNHVLQRMTESCAQTEDANISLRMCTIILGRNI